MGEPVRWRHVEAADLAPWEPGLRALEASIRYPIADGADHFTIDHGADYAAFYRGLGEAHYLVAERAGAVVGVFAGALRDAMQGDRRIPSVYLGDLKVAPALRGSGLARALAVGALKMMRQRRFRRWRLVYFAAMRGGSGDVTRSLRGVNPGRLLRSLGRLHVYFVDPARLAALDTRGSPPPPALGGLDLSPEVTTDRISTAGRKDLRIASTGEPWPLVHLVRGPGAWGVSHGHYLRRCGRLDWAPGAQACFALDARLTAQVAWLAGQGIEPGAACTVYGFAWPRALRPVRWLHLATSAI